MQLQIEREALKKESDKASRERLAKIEKELAELKAGSTTLQAQWKSDQETIRNSATCGRRSSKLKPISTRRSGLTI